ncbi:DUF4129 domain-containing protein [Marinithermus hydrothermalis]|uniref:DUF4129 domain-containing protein n=1 Tax=Marinithermus hydrothermalis TaxID=186192 RepID=UPI0002D4B4CB|nr:DUF4129 domain-containing protein [Marinithermus hydrothermalis]
MLKLGLVLIGAALWALPPALWPGLALGVGLYLLLRRTHLHGAFLWFAGVAGLYLFVGVELERAALQQAAVAWGKLTLVLWALGLSLSAMRAGSLRAVAWLSPLLLLRPDGGMLAWLLLAHVVWIMERAREQARSRGATWRTNRSALGVAAASVALVLLGLVGGRFEIAGPIEAAPAVHEDAPAAPSAVWEGTGRAPAGGGGRAWVVEEAPSPVTALARAAFPGIVAAALGGIVLFFVGLGAAFLGARAIRTPFKGVHLASLLAVAWTFGMLLLWFALLQEGQGTAGGGSLPAPAGSPGPGTAPGAVVPSPVPPALRDGLAGLGLLGAFVVLGGVLAALGVLALVWRGAAGRRSAVDRPVPASSHLAGTVPEEGYAGRVREVYRRFLELMRSHQPRQDHETPREYAARVGRTYAGLAAPVAELTRLYEPVRYGGRSPRSDAERAERLLQRIQAYWAREEA